jgi:oligopeptide/dipeptide ABC transporter ATP-binding protein
MAGKESSELERNHSLLDVRDLHTYFHLAGGRVVRAVDGVQLSIPRGSVVGLVGESGSGKSMTALSILRLLDPRARIERGEILLEGQDLVKMSEREMRRIRGRRISMVVQDPMTALNPLLTIGRQVKHALSAHQTWDAAALESEAIRLLDLVRLPDPERLLSTYPYELSGGMRQRVVIAMSLASHADLIIADEPTTALDVTIQLQILSLFKELRWARDLSMLFITHDLGVIAHVCERVCVMYRGIIVERGAVGSVLESPLHPYTQGLLESVPDPRKRGAPLGTMTVPAQSRVSGTAGCRYSSRCVRATARCLKEVPASVEVEPGHEAACHFPGE